MFTKFFKIIFIFSLVLFGVVLCFGQDGNGNQSKMDFPDTIKENLAKRRIKQEEEDFQELIQRCEEAVQLSEELNQSFEVNKRFSLDDAKKIEKLEKVVKRIRKDLGAADDKDGKADNPATLPKTLASIKEKASNILEELKKTGRFAISVIAVESSNTIFQLLKFLKFNKN